MRHPTPLIELPSLDGLTSIYVKDESVNPTGTFKDRLLERAVERSSAGTTLACISYGNTALSMAHYCSRDAGSVKGCVLIPQDLETWTLGPASTGSTASGHELVERIAKCLQVMRLPQDGPLLRPNDVEASVRAHGDESVQVVDITEGLDVPAYADIIAEAIGQRGRVPDVCLVPFGAGVLCNEITDYLSDTDCAVVPLSVPRRDSIARMLYGPVWVDVDELLLNRVGWTRHRSPDATGAPRRPYRVFAVSEEEVQLGVRRSRELGLSAEPSAAVGFGVLHRLHELAPDLPRDPDVLVVSTGNSIDALCRS